MKKNKSTFRLAGFAFKERIRRSLREMAPVQIKIEFSEKGKKYISIGKGLNLWDALGDAKEALYHQVFRKKDRMITRRKQHKLKLSKKAKEASKPLKVTRLAPLKASA